MKANNPVFALVSVIVPCLNEEATIQDLLDALYHQTYPRQRLEVIIADGLSTDQTRQKITQYVESHTDFQVLIVDNPEHTIPAALNKAIKASHGEFIVRLDAHSIPYPDYVEKSIAALQSGKGDNIGGIWDIRPGKTSSGQNTWVSRSIAAAASNPIGVGNALYRYTATPQKVDTVPFGSFRRELIDQIGFFNEQLHTNEDYEFNVRIIQHGGSIWLDPSIRSIYFSRSTYAALIRQYWRYGFWKSQMLVQNPRSLRWRQALPPLFLFSLLLLALLSIGISIARFALGFLVGIYAGVLMLVGIYEAWKARDFALTFGVPIAIAGMHFTWGSALWWGLLTIIFRIKYYNKGV